MTSASLFSTSIGDCGIAWRDDIVIGTCLPEKTLSLTCQRLLGRAGAALAEPTPVIHRAIRLMTELLAGGRTDLSSIACDLEGVEPFEADVYAKTRDILAGETTTYGAIARALGDVSLARRVGQALGRNPLPIIVPCHRVVGANGKLVGFSANGGVETKLKMLDIERAQFGNTPGLFGDLPLAAKPGP